MSAKLIQVIVTDIEVRGASQQEQNNGGVARRITQYWALDGKLLAEVDPCKEKVEK